MRHFVMSILALILAGPAVAHDGPHMHPHDGGTWIMWAAILTSLALLLVVVRR